MRGAHRFDHLLSGLETAGKPVVALNPRKGHPPQRTPAAAPVREDPETTTTHARRAEFHGPTLRSHPFTSERFHVLLNSLFKVLFNFPSRYLSAIGLVSVFSLRWSLPPALGCIPKQPDSEDTQRHGREGRTGLTPSLGEAPIRGTWTLASRARGRPIHHSSRRPSGRGIRCWAIPASLAVTEGILVSFASSA